MALPKFPNIHASLEGIKLLNENPSWWDTRKKLTFREARTVWVSRYTTETFQMVTFSILPTAFWRGYYNSYFTDEQTEAQGEEVICPRSQREPFLEPGLRPCPWAPTHILPGRAVGYSSAAAMGLDFEACLLVLVPPVLDTSCVTLSKLFNLSVQGLTTVMCQWLWQENSKGSFHPAELPNHTSVYSADFWQYLLIWPSSAC